MRYLSLFSGIEAASVACEGMGWEALAFAEIDPFPSAVLAERYPQVPNLGDVTKVNWRSFVKKCGRPDLVVGGSPCQSFSIAGTRTGLEGASGLMWEYVRAVREVRPEWVLWENVPGALSSSNGEDFRCLLEALDALGYGLAWRVLDAQFFGVAQRRERVFLVGRLGSRPPVEVLFEPEGVRWDPKSSREKRKELAAAAGRGPACASFKYSAGSGASSVGFEEENSNTLTADWHDPAVFRFAQNTRDEVRIQGDGTVCGALSANPGMKQTTYVCETAHTRSNGLGAYETDVMSTLATNNSAAIAHTQYGEEICGALTARYDSSPCADRGQNVVCTADDTVLAPSPSEVGDIAIQGSMIGRSDDAGPQGSGIELDGACFTLNCRDRHAVVDSSAGPMRGQNVICLSDDTANAAVDEDVCGTLKVGGDVPSVPR